MDKQMCIYVIGNGKKFLWSYRKLNISPEQIEVKHLNSKIISLSIQNTIYRTAPFNTLSIPLSTAEPFLLSLSSRTFLLKRYFYHQSH